MARKKGNICKDEAKLCSFEYTGINHLVQPLNLNCKEITDSFMIFYDCFGSIYELCTIFSFGLIYLI